MVTSMLKNAAPVLVAAGLPSPAVPASPYDAAFEARWDAWVARGQAHERRAQRRLVWAAGVIAIAAALVFALVR
jgi:hypothetical protein